MKTIQELNQLINHKNITDFIRPQRLSWLGHVERISPNRSVKSLYSWKTLGKKMKVPNWKDNSPGQDQAGSCS
jgi:hypothetical protein